MTIDTEGHLWVAHFGGGCVSHWDPGTGRRLGQIDLPATNITACWFGGETYEDLYITTAREGLDDAARASQPRSGGLFRARPGPQGRPAVLYAG